MKLAMGKALKYAAADGGTSATKAIVAELLTITAVREGKAVEKKIPREEIDSIASLLVAEIKVSAQRLAGHKRQVRYSPQVLQVALSLWLRSSTGYEEFKASGLKIMPLALLLKQMKAKMMYDDGNAPIVYGWLADEISLGKWTDSDRIGHLIVDEMKLRSNLYWNCKSHKMIGLASDVEDTLDLGSELKQLTSANKLANDEVDASKVANNVNQWRLARHSMQGLAL